MYILKKATLVFSLLLLLAAVSCIDTGADKTGSGSGTTATTGDGKAKMPVDSQFAALKVETLDGKQQTFGDYMGKPLVVNYFAMF